MNSNRLLECSIAFTGGCFKFLPINDANYAALVIDGPHVSKNIAGGGDACAA
jgi:hypothetical protein